MNNETGTIVSDGTSINIEQSQDNLYNDPLYNKIISTMKNKTLSLNIEDPFDVKRESALEK